jgi:hypothetical protein
VQHKADDLLKTMTDHDWSFLVTAAQVDMDSMPVSHTGERRPWTIEEDNLLLASVKEHGAANWTAVARQLKGRQPKQCRQRYFNKVRYVLETKLEVLSTVPFNHLWCF